MKRTRAIDNHPGPFAEQDLTDVIREVHGRTESPKSHRDPLVKSEPYEHTRHYRNKDCREYLS